MSEATKYLIVMRHGTTDYSKDGCLSNIGIEQINKVATALKKANLDPDLIINSPTPRTRESGSIIREHFNNKAKVAEIDLFMEEASHNIEILDVLLPIRTEQFNTALLSGHGETVNSFIYHMLDRDDEIKLLKITTYSEEYNKYLSGDKPYLHHLTAQGEALILKSNTPNITSFDDAEWKLHGYITKGKLTLADDIKPEPNFPGKKKDVGESFPVLMFKQNL